ncbi:MAG: peptidase M23 [Bacteroidetes bacterium HGW-Bacteroidetes-6]|jgi:murein DD-endopeptidase MepM/ murein hydrolase activator NlpD|nr:MAG: peptidase M23 [Bacteroidetes bacterium HGW-Bacteroidetes-6]
MFRKKAKFIIDPLTLSVKQVEKSGKYITARLLSGLGLSVILGFAIAFSYFRFANSPRENSLSREINYYQLKIQLLDNKADKVLNILSMLQDKDDRTYRTIFAMKPLSDEIRNAGIGGPVDYSAKFDVVENGDLLKSTYKKLSEINSRLITQGKSFSDLTNMVRNKERMLASIPSIMPVDKNKIHISSGFGWRQNPFTRSGSQFHPGIDFAGKIGTPIYATGDGIVTDPLGSMTGYGNVIVIEHGYGFETLYAHLSKKLVNVGDKVKRGQIIGLLGNTGPSTGPHIHYEVHRNGEKVNPINYIYSGFTNEEFQEMIKEAEENHKILS